MTEEEAKYRANRIRKDIKKRVTKAIDRGFEEIAYSYALPSGDITPEQTEIAERAGHTLEDVYIQFVMQNWVNEEGKHAKG